MLIPTVTPREFSSTVGRVSNSLPATFADWLALPEDRGAELLHGRIEYKAFPSLEHGRVQRKLGRFVDPFDHRFGDGNNPGGWWIGSEVDVIINGHGVRPDMVGWRRDKYPHKPRPNDKGAIDARPDWIAEVLSPSNRDRDLKEKFDIYQDACVPYYWILDPDARSLLVHTKHPAGYILVDGGSAKRILRPKPFDAIELRIGSLFAEDDEQDE
jgi:Uma2 family endonuclease